LGNEMYGYYQIGYKNAEDYAKIAVETAKMMRWVDPNIKLVACGGDDPEWNRIVLEHLTPLVDYISVHDYEGADNYYDEMGSLNRLEEKIRLANAVIEETDVLRTTPGKDPSAAILALSLPEIKNKRRMEIVVEEWNIWYRKWNIWRR